MIFEKTKILLRLPALSALGNDDESKHNWKPIEGRRRRIISSVTLFRSARQSFNLFLPICSFHILHYASSVEWGLNMEMYNCTCLKLTSSLTQGIADSAPLRHSRIILPIGALHLLHCAPKTQRFEVVKSIKCYRGGQKIDIIPSMSEILLKTSVCLANG